MAIETLLTFTGASLLLAIAPGPDNIFVLTHSAMHGSRSGIYITLGLCTGLIVHTVLVALGISTIFKVSVVAFTLLKTAGACYLLYLAWLALNARAAGLDERAGKKQSFFPLYRRGIIMNITNPKVAIFFMAFLPQFTHTTGGSITLQIVVLGTIFIISAFFVFSLISIGSGKIKALLIRSPKTQLVINRLAGIIFISLAVKLFISQNQ